MISKRNDGRTKGCDWPSQVGSCVADVLDQVLHPTSVPSLSVTSSLHVDTPYMLFGTWDNKATVWNSYPFVPCILVLNTVYISPLLHPVSSEHG